MVKGRVQTSGQKSELAGWSNCVSITTFMNIRIVGWMDQQMMSIPVRAMALSTVALKMSGSALA